MPKTSSLQNLLREGERSPMPASIKPMLCTLTKTPVSAAGYIHEIKWDGYRLIAFSDKKTVQLASRSGLDYTAKYPPLARAFKLLKHQVVLDGEAVVLNAAGNPDFDALQKFNGSNDPILFYAFDIIWLDGINLMNLELLKRKQILSMLLEGNEVIRYSEHFDNAHALYSQMQELGLEGIVSKKETSLYRPGERGTNWYKTPTEIRQEFVIGGWIESDKARPFRSLLFGAYKNSKFEWIGHAGGGFKDSEMSEIMRKMTPLEIKQSPFVNHVDTDGKPHWIKPVLVGNFKFATWTKSGRIRKPAIFLGFRSDKKASDVVREVPDERTTAVATKTPKKKAKLLKTSAASNWPLIEKQKILDEEVFDFGECSITINNIERQIWKDISKARLIQYYHDISPYILPHIHDRPQSLHVKPVNANAPGFYIKDMEGRAPDCAGVFSVKRKHKAEGKRDDIEYLVANNEASLIYMVNLGCIDINPWTSRTAAPDEPDYIIIDLDPSDDDFNKAVETARAVKDFFDSKNLKAFAKTSGKTGIHIYLPCHQLNFKQARSIAESICDAVHKLVPDVTTTSVSISNRGTKLYIDPNQNDFADTVAAPYSARPSHHPTVSTPLEWREIKPGLDPLQFNIDTIAKRLEKKGDLFEGVMESKIAIANTRQFKKILDGL